MAATTADRVVTELIADTSGHDPKIRTSAQVVEQYGQTVTRTTTAAEQSANRALAKIGTGVGNNGRVWAQAGQQAQDFFLQVQGGGNVLLAASQQLSQMQIILANAGGSASTFARIMGNPWVNIMSTAAIVLLPMIARLFDTRTELEKATDELTENARKAEIARQAQEAFGRTLPGIIQQIRSETEELERQNHALRNNAQAILEGSRARQADLQSQQRQRQAELRQAQEELTRLRNEAESAAPGTPEETQARGAADRAQARIRDLQARIAQLRRAIQAGEREIVEAEIGVQRRRAEALADPIAAINQRYDDMAAAAERAAEGNRQLRAALDQTLASIERQRQAALRAQRDTQHSGGGALVRPVAGAVLSPFGADRSGVPLNGRRIAGRSHQGVDLRGAFGSPVVAPEAGVATVRNAPGGLGLYVEIRADSGARNLLGHLSAANVRTGDRVSAGQLVGLVGNSGNARGGPPHLHYQRMVNGRWVDPMRSIGSSGAAQEAQQAAREAQRLAEQRQRDEERFQEQLSGLNADILNARRRQVQTEEEAAASDIAAIQAEQSERDQRIRNEAAQRVRRDEAQAVTANIEAGLLLAKSQELAQAQIAARTAQMQQRLDEQRIETAQRELNDQQSVLQARAQLARTALERRDIELHLLEIQRQEELLAIEKQRDLTAEQRARAVANVNQRYALGQQSVLRSTAGPMEAFFNSIPKTAAELNEALEGVAANGLQALNDGLAQAASRFLHLGGVAGRVLDQILSDLIRIALQQAELAAFGGGKGGGGGIFSAIGRALGLASAGAGGGKTDYFGGALSGLGNLFPGAKGFATGGSMMIGGFGGVDQNLVSINGHPAFLASRGERLTVTPQGKALGFAGGRAMGGGYGGAPPIIVNVDARDAVLSHAVRGWVREGIEEATARGTVGGFAMTSRRSSRQQRQTL